MKKYIICAYLVSFCPFVIQAGQGGWKIESAEQSEYNQLKLKINKINESFVAIGAYHSSGRNNAVFQLLKEAGTPVSYKILQELVKSGELPKSYLNLA